MNNNFTKFKNRILVEAILKSIIPALAIGLLTFSIPYLYIRLNKIEFNVLYLILTSSVILLMLFGVLFLIFKPTKIKVAKRLDKEFNLNEKVQTMVEFENDNTFIVQIQREKTISILSNIPVKSLSLKISIFFIILLFLALGTTITAISIQNSEEPPIVDPGDDDVIIDKDYDLDEFTQNAIKDLIRYVQESEIDEPLKFIYVTELTDLLTELEGAKKESERDLVVNDVINNVKIALSDINTNDDFYDAYKSLANNNTMFTLIQAIFQLDESKISKSLEGFITTINGLNSAIEELYMIYRDVKSSNNLSEEESLNKSYIQFMEKIYKCKDPNQTSNIEASSIVRDNVIKVTNEMKSVFSDVIAIQAENSEVAKYIEKKLIEIFGLNKTDVENGSGESSTEGPEIPENPTDKDPSEGGWGTGDKDWGTDDLFHDKDMGTVEYRDVITGYKNEIEEKYKNNEITEEQYNLICSYFDKLYEKHKK